MRWRQICCPADAKKFSSNQLTTVNLRKCLVNSKQIAREANTDSQTGR